MSGEFKADMAFKCHLCKKVYMNNIEFMKHLSLHVETDRASAVDLVRPGAFINDVTSLKLRPEVDFSYVFRSATSIEIALSIFAVRRCPTLSHKFVAKKLGDTANRQKLRMRNRPQDKTIGKFSL